MMKDIDIKNFQAKLNEGRANDPLNEDGAADALRNLGEFFWLLYKINEREKIVPIDVLNGTTTLPDPHNS